MDESTCTPAFNAAAPKAIANIKRQVKYKRKREPDKKPPQVISLKGNRADTNQSAILASVVSNVVLWSLMFIKIVYLQYLR